MTGKKQGDPLWSLVAAPDPVCVQCREPVSSVDAASGMCALCLWGPPPEPVEVERA